MAASHHHPAEIDKVGDQHQRHQHGEGQQQHVNDVDARRWGIGGRVFHVREDARHA